MSSFFAVIRHPLTWAAVALVVAAEFAFYRQFAPGPVAALGALALGVVSVGCWSVLLLRSRSYLAQRLLTPTAAMEAAASQVVILRADLDGVGSRQGMEQLARLEERLNVLIAVLKHRLTTGEVTFGRYISTARQLYLASLDNLSEIVVALTSISAVDRAAIDRRLSELSGTSGEGGRERIGQHAQREMETLEQRRELHEQQTDRVAELFVQNEAAVTALLKTATALADARIGVARSDVNVDDAVRELEALAARAGKYAEK